MQINVNDKDLINLQKNNKILKEESTSLLQKNTFLTEEVHKLRNVKENLRNCEAELKTVANKYSIEMEKCQGLGLKYNTVTDELKYYKSKYSGENTLENLKSRINNLENEMLILRQNYENVKQYSSISELKLKELEEENNEICNSINSELKIIMQWIETYFGVYYNKDYEIPDLPLTISKKLKTKVNMDQLKDLLIKSRLNLNNELAKWDRIIQDLKDENREYLANKEKAIFDTNMLKNELIRKEEESHYLQMDLQNQDNNYKGYNTQIESLKNEIYSINSSNLSFFEKIASSLIDIVNLLQNKGYRYENTFPNLNIKDCILEYLSILKNNVYSLNSSSEPTRKQVYINNKDTERIYELEQLVKESEDINAKLKEDISRLKSDSQELYRENELIKQKLRQTEDNLNALINDNKDLTNENLALRKTQANKYLVVL